MAQVTRATNKTNLRRGRRPPETEWRDLLDSVLHLLDDKLLYQFRNLFIWRPGGTASHNVYTNRETLKADIEAVRGERILLVDDSALTGGAIPELNVQIDCGDGLIVAGRRSKGRKTLLSIVNGGGFTGSGLTLRNITTFNARTSGAALTLTGADAYALFKDCVVGTIGQPWLRISGADTVAELDLYNVFINSDAGPVIDITAGAEAIILQFTNVSDTAQAYSSAVGTTATVITGDNCTPLNRAGLLGTVVEVLSNAARMRSVQTTVTYSDFSGAGTTASAAALDIPANSIPYAIRLRPTFPFAGLGLSAATLGTDYTSLEVDLTTVNATANAQQALSWDEDGPSLSAPTPLNVQLTTTGCNVDDLTAGAVEVTLLYYQL
jgi:hypothetical protein